MNNNVAHWALASTISYFKEGRKKGLGLADADAEGDELGSAVCEAEELGSADVEAVGLGEAEGDGEGLEEGEEEVYLCFILLLVGFSCLLIALTVLLSFHYIHKKLVICDKFKKKQYLIKLTIKSI